MAETNTQPSPIVAKLQEIEKDLGELLAAYLKLAQTLDEVSKDGPLALGLHSEKLQKTRFVLEAHAHWILSWAQGQHEKVIGSLEQGEKILQEKIAKAAVQKVHPNKVFFGKPLGEFYHWLGRRNGWRHPRIGMFAEKIFGRKLSRSQAWRQQSAINEVPIDINDEQSLYLEQQYGQAYQELCK